MTIDAPLKRVLSSVGESRCHGVVWEPLHECEDQGRGWTLPLYHLRQIDVVIEEEVRVKALSVLVDQTAEAEASPACCACP